jgi:hypothetical protein
VPAPGVCISRAAVSCMEDVCVGQRCVREGAARREKNGVGTVERAGAGVRPRGGPSRPSWRRAQRQPVLTVSLPLMYCPEYSRAVTKP